MEMAAAKVVEWVTDKFVDKIVEWAAFPTVDQVVNFVLDLGIRQVTYIVYYRENVDELKDSVEDLRRKKKEVEHQVNDVKNLQNIKTVVEISLWKVEELETKVEEFWSDECNTKTQLLDGLFPCLRNRCRLGRQAKEMTKYVKSLSPMFDQVSYERSNDAILFNDDYVEFDSRKSTMEKIMAKLEDPTVRMIGLYGPGGVAV